MKNKSYEYYHGGRTPAEDGELAAKKENSVAEKKSIKIMWMMNDQILNISYADTADEAEKIITKSRDRRWGKAMIFFWSDRLGRYVSIPE